MSKPNDGGPAFPQFTQNAWGNPLVTGGASLRDWFAGQALAGLCAISNSDVIAARSDSSAPDVRRVIAYTCYLMADAMLEMRDRGGDEIARGKP